MTRVWCGGFSKSQLIVKLAVEPTVIGVLWLTQLLVMFGVEGERKCAMIDDLTLARSLHILAVVIWIGGVYFVTFIVLPSLKATANGIARFEAIETLFARHAKIVVTLAGASGFYMLHKLDGWAWYGEPSQWWVFAMTALWLLFTIVLFVLEPLFLHAWFMRQAAEDPARTLAWARRFHLILTLLSLTTIAGAIYGVHG